jgi:hypothetical protein
VLLGDSSRFSGGKACISAASQGPTEEETPTVSCCRSYGPALTTPAREQVNGNPVHELSRDTEPGLQAGGAGPSVSATVTDDHRFPGLGHVVSV